MRTAVFLQARLDSQRLVNKVIYTLEDCTVIEYAMKTLRTIPCDVYALLCDARSRAVLQPLAERSGFQLFVGSKRDVLKRFVFAIEHFSVDVVIRATGDNPFVSALLAEKLLGEFRKTTVDYCAYDGLPLGTGVEIVGAKALLDAHNHAKDSYDREHVCPYLYRNPETFTIVRMPAPKKYQKQARVTLDTIEDYQYLCALVAARDSIKQHTLLEIDELLQLMQRIESKDRAKP